MMDLGSIPITDVVEVTPETVVQAVSALVNEGLRFETITCFDHEESYELLYTFVSGLDLRHLRLVAPHATRIPSISGVCFPAFLVENEAKELFGVDIEGIVIDYGGHLLLTEDSGPSPMQRYPRPEGTARPNAETEP